MIDHFLDSLHFNQWSWLVPWLFGLSVAVFIGSIIGVWIVLIRLPEDYLTRDHAAGTRVTRRSPGQLLRKVMMNVIGIAFLLAGIVMLLTPGQGILSIFVGITFMSFPGKRRLVRRILAQPKVFNAINKLRKKANKPPLAETESSAAG